MSDFVLKLYSLLMYCVQPLLRRLVETMRDWRPDAA